MQVTLLKSKIHRAMVTDASLHYEGSLSIDVSLMERVGLLPYEKILVGNITCGDRFETYAIPAPAGSKIFSLNGATARLGQIGDLLVIMSFAQVDEKDIPSWKPKVVVLSEGNSKIVEGV